MKQALHQYEVAKHLLTVTFPLLKDPKLLPGISQSLLNSLERSMEILLSIKDVTHNNTFNHKLSLFAQHYPNLQEYTNLIQHLHELMQAKKSAPIEFRRKDSYVICSPEYEISPITANDLKQQLQQTEEFLRITTENIKKDNYP